ncbi:oleate hydratase [Granulibacter bethesdensis]|nr:oleate hydratase [Granulibacter bethesdensis]
MTESATYGDMDHAPVLERDWTLWKNLARLSPVFGKPKKFYSDVGKSTW